MCFDENGHMLTGWVHSNGGYYYLGSDGKMVSGTTLTIDGNNYSFDANGAYTGGGRIAAKEVNIASSGSKSGSSSSGSTSTAAPGSNQSRGRGQASDQTSGPGAGSGNSGGSSSGTVAPAGWQ